MLTACLRPDRPPLVRAITAALLALCLTSCADARTAKARPATPAIYTAIYADKTPARLSVRTSGKSDIFEMRDKNAKAARLILPLPADISVSAGARHLTVLSPPDDKQMLVLDSHASKPQSMSRCQAGAEVYARLLDFTGAKAAQLWQLKVASCLDNLELADGGVSWAKDTQTLTVNWLSGPGGTSGVQTFAVKNGALVQVR